MKKVFLGMGIIAAASLTSCKKDGESITIKNGQPVNNAIGGEKAKEISARITAFYELMKERKGRHVASKGTSNDEMEVTDANFLVEGTYNMYAVWLDDNTIPESFKFSIAKPLEADGKVKVDNLADAFWEIKNQIMVVYNGISFANKDLTFFDLNTRVENGQIIFDVAAAISKDALQYTGASGQTTFTEPANHGWAVSGNNPTTVQVGSFHYYYGYGQNDINIAAKAGYNVDNTKPDARTMLRQKGKRNYWNGTLTMPGYYTNVVTTPLVPGNIVASPISTYAATVPGYDNQDKWFTEKFCIGTGVNAPISDPDIVFKNYLTTPMMNFYLSYIPGYIAGHVPGGKRFYDFNIWYGFNTAGGTQSTAYPGSNSYRQWYQYDVSYGDFIQSRVASGPVPVGHSFPAL